jgi:RNA polymerase sigma-70 factor (ECF subfamily)
MAADERTEQEPPAHAVLDERERRLRALFVSALDGDGAAYHAFLKLLGPHLRAYLRRRLRSLPDDVEDLVQDTLIALHEQRHTYRTELPVTAWVQAIARYKLIDLLRSRRIRQDLDDPIDDHLSLLAFDDTEAHEARRDVDTLMQHLPDHQRLPILHTKLHGLSVAEAAAVTGMSESAVKVGVHRGIKALAARLRGRR